MTYAIHKALFRALALLLGLSFWGEAAAQDVTRLYPPDVLQQAGKLYARNIQGMWEEDLVARLEPEERQRAGSVTLLLPVVGVNRHPLEYYTDTATKRVFLPIASVKFLDDLSIALAYYQSQGCDLATVSDYAALLKRRPMEFDDPPLTALGVPEDALEDLYVDDVSQKLLKSTLFFLASHEYAHVMYGHRPYSEITSAQAQAQEIEADTFALDVMRRIGVAPTAMSQFFMLSTRFEAAPQDFQSPADYQAQLARSTHPVSALRLEKVAANIEDNLAAYANAQDDPPAYRKALADNVDDLRRIASEINDSSMREYLELRLRDVDAKRLSSSCRGS